MLFSSNVFLFAYLPIVLLLYYASPRPLRNAVLLVTSLFFYGWGEPVYLILMVATILLNYLFAAGIHLLHQKARSAKLCVGLGIAANLAILGFFKYAGFFARQLQPLFPGLSVPELRLPIGISFYVFQSMSYIIDVYRRTAPVQKNPVDFGAYVTLFPQLIAGPIVRYADVAQQLKDRKESISAFASGISCFCVGLGKKLLLANPMGSLWSLLQAQEGTLAAWVGILAYSLQLYFDFSGYSDMARGLGRMLGFEFLENFHYPYISQSITEFWRRWHISLSTWFKEYVYIPLGGNRCRLPRQIINLLIVWGLTGLWHGASWNFVLWGLYYAALLILEKLVLGNYLPKIPRLLRHLYTMLAVVLGWGLFYFEDAGALYRFFGKLFSLSATPQEGLALILGFTPMLLLAMLASTPLAKRLYTARQDAPWVPWVAVLATAALLLVCIAALASQSYNPFIYFRF